MHIIYLKMNNLCYDVLMHILEYIDLCDIYNVKFISTEFDDLCNDNLLWKIFYKNNYRVKRSDLNVILYMDAYKKCYHINLLKCELNMNDSIKDIMNSRELSLTFKKIKNIPSEIGQLLIYKS